MLAVLLYSFPSSGFAALFICWFFLSWKYPEFPQSYRKPWDIFSRFILLTQVYWRLRLANSRAPNWD